MPFELRFCCLQVEMGIANGFGDFCGFFLWGLGAFFFFLFLNLIITCLSFRRVANSDKSW